MNRTSRKIGFASTFLLTLEEKKVICFVLLAFVLGLVTKQYRGKQPPPTPPVIKATSTDRK